MVRKNRKRINKASASVMRSFIWMIWMRLQLPYACQKTYRPGCTIWQFPPMTTSVSTGVSSINDDRTDNYFEVKRPRFIPVEEDGPAEILLCNEYGRLD